MIKSWTIEDIRIEPDGTKTIFFDVKKSSVNIDGSVTTRGMKTTYVVPESYTEQDIDAELFKILENSGWI